LSPHYNHTRGLSSRQAFFNCKIQRMSYTLETHYTKILADTITPVSAYLKIRDRFPNSLLLESSDYHANDNSFSYICCNPIAHIKVEDHVMTQSFPDGKTLQIPLTAESDVPQLIDEFSKEFSVSQNGFKFIYNGLFGYMAYDAVRYFEDIEIAKKDDSTAIPDIYYAVYQNIIAIDHFKNQVFIFAHCHNTPSNVEEMVHLLRVR